MNYTYLQKLKPCFQYHYSSAAWIKRATDFLQLLAWTGLGLVSAIGVVLFVPVRITYNLLIQPFFDAYRVDDKTITSLMKWLHGRTPVGKEEAKQEQDRQRAALLASFTDEEQPATK